MLNRSATSAKRAITCSPSSQVVQCITGRKAAEEAGARAKNVTAPGCTGEDYAIFRTDLAGRATSWNEGVKRILGFDEAEFGQDILIVIFTPEDVRADVADRELQTAVAEGSASDNHWLQRGWDALLRRGYYDGVEGWLGSLYRVYQGISRYDRGTGRPKKPWSKAMPKFVLTRRNWPVSIGQRSAAKCV